MRIDTIANREVCSKPVRHELQALTLWIAFLQVFDFGQIIDELME